MCYRKGCTTKGTAAIVDKTYCARHFVEAIEKRVRKDVRTRKGITTKAYTAQKAHTPKRAYSFLDSKTKEVAAAKRLLDNIFQGHLRMQTGKKAGKNTIIPTNMDREINRMLPFYLEKKKISRPQGILFLDNVTDDEMLDLCKIWKIPGQREPRNPLVEAIEAAHPGTKFALKKSLDQVMHRSGDAQVMRSG
jgi:hypothetical protein